MQHEQNMKSGGSSGRCEDSATEKVQPRKRATWRKCTLKRCNTKDFQHEKSATWKELTLLWRIPLSYRNQSIDLRSKSMDGFYMITASVMKEILNGKLYFLFSEPPCETFLINPLNASITFVLFTRCSESFIT